MISRKSPHQGFMLADMLITLALLAVIAPVISQLFGSIFYVYRTTAESHTHIRSYEAATDCLRKDVWSAAKINVLNPQTVEITSPTGKLTWTIEPQGALTRTRESAPPTRWEQAASNLTFNKDSTELLLTEPNEDPALATHFFAPMAQLSGQPQ